MFVKTSLLVVIFLVLSGCASTKKVKKNCSPKFEVVMGESLHLVAPLKEPRLRKYLDKKNINTNGDNTLVLKLVKGYVNIYNMILEGHAVLKVEGKDTYFRGSDTDSNVANTDGEWRTVFNKAVKNAIDKVEVKYSQCLSTS